MNEHCILGTILVENPWVHAGEGATVFLKCKTCTSRHVSNPLLLLINQLKRVEFQMWWSRDGEKINRNSYKFRYLHHKSKSEFMLKVQGVRRTDFGQYYCHTFSNDTKLQDKASVYLTGVPYAPVFDQPVEFTESTFNLSWRCNSSLNAPVINYQLEFKELPHGVWINVNIPADPGQDTKAYRHAYDMAEFTQSYTLKGLSKHANYQAKIKSRNEFGLSAETRIDLIKSIDSFVQDEPSRQETNSEPLSIHSSSARRHVFNYLYVILTQVLAKYTAII